MYYDEIVIFVVDDTGHQLEKLGPVQWSKEIRNGEMLEVSIDGQSRRFRVINTRPGEGGSVFVKVRDLHAAKRI